MLNTVGRSHRWKSVGNSAIPLDVTTCVASAELQGNFKQPLSMNSTISNSCINEENVKKETRFNSEKEKKMYKV